MSIKLPKNHNGNLPLLEETMVRFFEPPSSLEEFDDPPLGPGLEAGFGHHYYVLDWNQDFIDLSLADARLAGWRYLVRRGEEMVADIYLDFTATGSEPRFSNISYGPISSLTISALGRAEEMRLTDDLEYEIRHLEVPSLYFAAVWLHSGVGNQTIGKNDLIIPVLKGFQRISEFEMVRGDTIFRYLAENFSEIVNPI